MFLFIGLTKKCYLCNLIYEETSMKKIIANILFMILLMVLTALPGRVSAQEPYSCEITCDADMPVCSQEPVTLSVPNNYLYRFRWSPGNYTTNSITVKPFETTTYHVYVTDTAGFEICQNSITVTVKERFQSSLRQLKLTCSNSENDNGQTAQVKVDVTGVGAPYTYYWEERVYNRWKELGPMHYAPNDPSIAIGLKAYTYYRVEITDSRGCVQYDSISTRGFPTPDIRTHCEPDSAVYLQNPDITFSFVNNSEDSIAVEHFFWTFEHDITSTKDEPTFTYVEPGNFTATVTVYDDCGCDTTFNQEVTVLPVELKIPSVFTPNGDNHNDTFVIKLKSNSETPGSGTESRNRDGDEDETTDEPLSKYYKSTELVIFNRWGRVVYHSNDYQNDWDGGGLSDGTYFYVLKCKGLKEEVQYQGSVMILSHPRNK